MTDHPGRVARLIAVLTSLSILTLVASLALLWTRAKKLGWSTPVGAALSLFEFLALAISIIQLGWIGLMIFVMVNIAGFLISGVVGAAQVDADMAAAAAHGGYEKVEMQAALSKLLADKRLTILGTKKRAKIVLALADRSRSPAEIQDMGSPIGMLYVIGEPRSIEWLVERFDSIMRLYGHCSEEAMDVADTLTASFQRSASTLEETIEALVVAGGGSASVPSLATAV